MTSKFRKLRSSVARGLGAGALACALLVGSAGAGSVAHASPRETFCGDYEFSRVLWHGSLPVSAKVNGHFCADGKKIWESNWGPDCSNTTLYGTPSVTWCGAYNSGNSFMEPGENFNMTIPAGGGTYSCYLRGHLNQWATITQVWGSC